MNATMSDCCLVCGSENVSKEKRPTDFEVRGKTLQIEVESVVCSSCGCVEAIEDAAEIAFAQFRASKGLLTPKQIKDIRKKYGLSQKSIAALLGMSEATINRYEKGALQDEAHDQAIRSCDSQHVMRDLLNRRGERLTAWQRARTEQKLNGEISNDSPCVDWDWYSTERTEQTGFRPFDFDRYAAVVVWFCEQVPKVTATSLNKLLFYADFLFYQSESVSLTGSAYRRFPYGPVPEHYGDLRSEMETRGIIEVQEVEYQNGFSGEEFSVVGTCDVEWSSRELAILNAVANKFKTFTPRQISDYSHEENAWKETEDKKLISYRKAAELSLSLE